MLLVGINKCNFQKKRLTAFCSVGIDIGKLQDPSAVSVAMANDEKMTSDAARFESDQVWETHFYVARIERLLLDMKYPQQVNKFLEVIEKAIMDCRIKCIEPPNIFVDVTGVGESICDMLESEGKKRGLFRTILRVRFSHGDKITRSGNRLTIGKAWFANRLQILVQSQRIHLLPILEASALAKEMLDYDIDVDETRGKTTYGAMRLGKHDDMVTALGLATLE